MGHVKKHIREQGNGKQRILATETRSQNLQKFKHNLKISKRLASEEALWWVKVASPGGAVVIDVMCCVVSSMCSCG